MKIEFVSHASLFLRTGEASLMIDPFYFLDEIVGRHVCLFPPRPLTPDHFGRIDYLFSSHDHVDHGHPETLRKLRPRVGTVLIPAERPELRERYRSLGFRDVRALDHGKTVRLQKGFALTCFWSDPVDSVLVVEGDGVSVFHENDARPTPRILKEIGDRFRIDYAFLLYTQAQDLFPLLLGRPHAELAALIEERERANVRFQVGVVSALQPKVIVPYAWGMAYFQPDQVHLNGYGRDVPATFCRKLGATFPDREYWVLRPGDVIDTTTHSVTKGDAACEWGETAAEGVEQLCRLRAGVDTAMPPFDGGSPRSVKQRVTAYLKRRASGVLPPDLEGGVWLRVTGRGAPLTWGIDLAARKSWAPGARPPPSFSPSLKLEMPARVAEDILTNRLDPYSYLFTYRLRFRRTRGEALSPRNETAHFVNAAVGLFSPEPPDVVH